MSQISWIASYPRSGNTWMRFMLTSYLMDAAPASGRAIDNHVPDFHRLLRSGRLQQLLSDRTLLEPDNPRPVLVKTHYLPSTRSMQRCRSVAGKVVYLVRNPRDVLLSAARFTGVTPSAESHSWAEDFLAKRGGSMWPDLTGTWPQNVREWTSPETVRRHFPGIRLLPLRYEDVRAEPVAKLQEVLTFLNPGAVIDPDRVRRAVENSSMERMRALEETQGESSPRYVNQGLHNQSLTIFGEDVETAYKRLMDEDEDFSVCLQKFGYAM
jgi:hypothetical protein